MFFFGFISQIIRNHLPYDIICRTFIFIQSKEKKTPDKLIKSEHAQYDCSDVIDCVNWLHHANFLYLYFLTVI